MTEDESQIAEANAKIEAMYALLRADYGRTLPAKVKQLRQIVLKLRDYGLDQDVIDQARLEVHRAKGTIGSYGYTELAKMIEAVESLIQQRHLPPGGKLAPEKLWKNIESQVEEIFELSLKEAVSIADGITGDAT